MNKQTKAEQLFGKRSKDLNEEELREYYKILQRERRKRPDVQDYIKRISKEYQKNNREKINQAKREWNKKNPDKIKLYRNIRFKREIAVLEKALELACKEVDMITVITSDKVKTTYKDKKLFDYFKTKAKEMIKK